MGWLYEENIVKTPKREDKKKDKSSLWFTEQIEIERRKK